MGIHLFSGFSFSCLVNLLFISFIWSSEAKFFIKLITSIILIAFGTFIFTVMIVEEENQWNNGYCVNCETQYQAISYYRGNTRYECPSCHYAFTKEW